MQSMKLLETTGSLKPRSGLESLISDCADSHPVLLLLKQKEALFLNSASQFVVQSLPHGWVQQIDGLFANAGLFANLATVAALN